MDNVYSDIKNIIRAHLKKENINSVNSNIIDIYNLSASLNVPCVVGYTLKKNNLYDSIFDKSIYKSLNRYTVFSNYKDKIKELFDSEKIRYIFLKGETVARYYDEPFLRFSADLDIIVYENDYEKAIGALKNKMNFEEKQSSLSEKTLVNKDGVSIDLHKFFEPNNPILEKEFEYCFDKTELDDNNKYVYLLEHEAKHFVTGQLDLRFFVDLYYLRKNINKEIVSKMLDKLNLGEFEEKLNSYLDYVLLLHNPSDIDNKIEQYIISYAKDQGANNRVNNNQNKAIYFIKHAFPSFKTMKGVFPILEKMPILLPWYYVVRIARVLKTDRRKYVMNEIKSSINHSNQLINDLGISGYNKQ